MPEVDVFAQIGGEDVLAGHLWSHRRRGRESATFSYSTDYLARDDAYELDPMLPLVAGPQQTPAGRETLRFRAGCLPGERKRTEYRT